MKKNKDELLTSVGDLISYLNKPIFGHGTILFRGQSDREWKLLPSIADVGRNKRQRDPLYRKSNEANTDSLLLAEERMFRQLKRRSHPFLNIRPDSDWDWLALAQHYGIPTRLLDWSINALAALWFTVDKPPKKKSTSSRSVMSTPTPDNDSSNSEDEVKWEQDPKFVAYKPGSFWIFQPKEGPIGEHGDFISTKPGDPGPFDANCPAGVFAPGAIA